VLQQVVHHAPPPLDRPIPRALEILLFDGLLVKSREQRLQTMGEVVNLLDRQIAAMRPGVPDALDTFDEPNAEIDVPLADPRWAGESWFDDDPDLEHAPAAPLWEVEIWP
jgi:hypothetical protein